MPFSAFSGVSAVPFVSFTGDSLIEEVTVSFSTGVAVVVSLYNQKQNHEK